jgi:hypothetical protein
MLLLLVLLNSLNEDQQKRRLAFITHVPRRVTKFASRIQTLCADAAVLTLNSYQLALYDSYVPQRGLHVTSICLSSPNCVR